MSLHTPTDLDTKICFYWVHAVLPNRITGVKSAKIESDQFAPEYV